MRMENMSQSVYRKKSKVIEVSQVDNEEEPSEDGGFSVPDEIECEEEDENDCE